MQIGLVYEIQGMKWCINSGFMANWCWPVEMRRLSSITTQYILCTMRHVHILRDTYPVYMAQSSRFMPDREREIYMPGCCRSDDRCRQKPNKQTSTHYSPPLSPWTCSHRSKLKLKLWIMQTKRCRCETRFHKTQDLQDLQDLITAEDDCGPVGLEPEDSVN